jgi:hypothetical protein
MAHIDRYGDPIPDLKRQAGAALARAFEGCDVTELAEFLETDQPRISDIRRGRLEWFSLERLLRYLVRCRRRVELRIEVDRPPRRGM